MPNQPLISSEPLNNGVVCQDSAAGIGYLMYSAESVHTRFAANPTHGSSADHFICVKHNGSEWQYDKDTAYITFEPRSTDILVADVDFTNDVVTDLVGSEDRINGIVAGYITGDLDIIVDQWNGAFNDGEYIGT